MGFYRGPNIVTDGLVFAVDAGSTRSYAGSGTTVNNLAGSNTGTLINGVAFSTNNGGSWDFDSVDDYINVPNASNLSLTNQGTISVWINPSTLTQGSYAGLVSKASGGSTNQQSYGLSWRQIRNAFWGEICNGSGTYNQVTAPFPTVANVWYNIVFTWNGSQLAIYNNGVSVGTLTQTINCQILATDLTIGGYTYKGAGGSDEYFNGKISNTKLYNVGLTAAEVTQNFNAQKSRFGL